MVFPAEVTTSMNFSALLILSFGMSMDAFAVAIGKGAALQRPQLREALRTGLIFGVIETITPLLGWSLGQFATHFVARWDHWIAFTLLCFLGGRMVIEGCRQHSAPCEPAQQHGLMLLIATAIATSLDAMAIGVSLAFLQVNILLTALLIGLSTFTMTTIGMLIGRLIGPLLGKRAEILGGVVLIAIGAQILWQHFA
ncbi:putative manganese efflux pump MntP [Mixta theicola]|nr:putative manganese efflux pump MntP [Mixta theicola]